MAKDNTKKTVAMVIRPTIFRRLKMLAVKRDLTIGETVLFLLDAVDPMPIEEEI